MERARGTFQVDSHRFDPADMGSIEVIAPSLHRRTSGITATIIAVVPHQAKLIGIGTLGPNLPATLPRLSWANVLIRGRKPPRFRPIRLWHARRNLDMVAGLLLRHGLRQPLLPIFTSAAQRHHKPFTRFLYRRMAAVIATSKAAASYLEVPATVIRHGVDVAVFHPAEDRAAAWRMGGLPGSVGIGIFGRLRAQKGTDLFVEAMLALLPRYPEATAVVIGETVPTEVGFRRALEEKIAAAGLSERIYFLGRLPPEDIAAWYRRLAIVAAPARWEGFGLTPLEAMASGAVPVATTAGAFAEQIVDGETGSVVPPDDLGALIAALDRLLADPVRRETMAKAAREHVVAHFNIEAEAEAINRVYRSLWDAAST